ncbi:glycerol kinase [Kordiimonas sediminis]|uniref:glycerol kinase n=1 Tax=Kordiimonas sediminis TaxID=1735581 RepID=A0A919E9S9_9PROT|nr:glycerol kinase GlpK [Kordiimonas sediminis]GHF27935.1 glycerol kinase [Kordiimonas sediminis]
MGEILLAIDQGTTSTRVLAFDAEQLTVKAVHQIPLKQYYPSNGWVEHDAEEIWQATVTCLKTVLEQLSETTDSDTPTSIGITNQRETTVLWDRKTGHPVHKAIVWQDRRTASHCEELSKDTRLLKAVKEQTGLLLDPYFSATKIAWILDTHPDLRQQAQNGDILFGNIESYILYRLTHGGSHKTDATNASRTMLCDIRQGTWSEDLLNVFDIPKTMMPEICDNTHNFGSISSGLPGAGLPIYGMVGDQQAAAIGQACTQKGSIKSTYGTGCFLLENTGQQLVYSQNRLLTTIAYQTVGIRSYALEGSIFNAGTVIQWLRDDLGILKSASESETIVSELGSTDGVYFVPAFTGMGAPHWDADARGMITGLTRDSKASHIIRAGLESVVYQTNDLISALIKDGASKPGIIRIDGGMAANDWFAQFLANICDVRVEVPRSLEATAIGAALCAGVGEGRWPTLADAAKTATMEKSFKPVMTNDERQNLLSGWHKAVARCLL